MYKDGKRLSPLNPNPFTGEIYIGSICPAVAPKTAPQGQKRLNLPRGEARSDSDWDILILVDSANGCTAMTANNRIIDLFKKLQCFGRVMLAHLQFSLGGYPKIVLRRYMKKGRSDTPLS